MRTELFKRVLVGVSVGVVALCLLFASLLPPASAGTAQDTTTTNLRNYPDVGGYKAIKDNAYKADQLPGQDIITYTTSALMTHPYGMALISNSAKSCSMTIPTPNDAGDILWIVQIDSGTAGHYLQTASSGISIACPTNTQTTMSALSNRIYLSAQNQAVQLISASSTLWIMGPVVGNVSATAL